MVIIRNKVRRVIIGYYKSTKTILEYITNGDIYE